MTIEQRLVRDNGTTDGPELAVWLLADGTWVNGSKEGRQRDVDHHEIGQYFKPSKHAEPGSAYLYMLKFMRRGNIRVGCGGGYAFAEMRVPPTEAQARELIRHFAKLSRYGVDCMIERRSGKGDRVHMDVDGFKAYVRRYCRSHAA